MRADALIGTNSSTRPNRARVEVYRGLDHGTVRKACDKMVKDACGTPKRGASDKFRKAEGADFPRGMKDLADAFGQLQDARHGADCNPMIRLDRPEALNFADLAAVSTEKLKNTSLVDRKAIAAWVLISSKGATDARRRVGEEAQDVRSV